jgi:hypothetical protein
LDLEDTTLLERHFWQYIQAFPAVYSSYYGHEENGQFHGANQYPDLPLQVTRATPEDNRIMHKFKADDQTALKVEELSTACRLRSA